MKCVIIFTALLAISFAQLEDAPVTDAVVLEDVASVEPEAAKGRALKYKYSDGRYFTTTPSWLSKYFTSTTKKPVVYEVPKALNEDRNAQLLKYENEMNPDGSYQYAYEQTNGVEVGEKGQIVNYSGVPGDSGLAVEGYFGWTSKEGTPVFIRYISDNNGYQPQGDAIPTSPPIPPLIMRALEYIKNKVNVKRFNSLNRP